MRDNRVKNILLKSLKKKKDTSKLIKEVKAERKKEDRIIGKNEFERKVIGLKGGMKIDKKRVLVIKRRTVSADFCVRKEVAEEKMKRETARYRKLFVV